MTLWSAMSGRPACFAFSLHDFELMFHVIMISFVTIWTRPYSHITTNVLDDEMSQA
jgi:hypothetical protein